jgi:uncharacterized membrane protein (DUF4010 family)
MFNPAHTLLFAALLSALTIGLSWMGAHLGDQATKYGAIAAGMVDMHASSAAILSVAAATTLNSISKHGLLITILSIVSINASTKMMVSYAGSRAFFRQVAPPLLLSTSLSWLLILLL